MFTFDSFWMKLVYLILFGRLPGRPPRPASVTVKPANRRSQARGSARAAR
jgi:hypothetical protein